MLRMWTSSFRIKSIPPALRSNLANRSCLRRSTNRTPHDYALPCTIPKYCCVVVSFLRKHYAVALTAQNREMLGQEFGDWCWRPTWTVLFDR